MFKYRRLTLDELQTLEDSFIRFLAVQSITGEDWKRIQQEEPQKQMELIDQFSDMVMEKTLHNVKILEHRTDRRILFYQFLETEARLYGLEFQKGIPVNLTDSFKLSDLAELIDNPDIKSSFISGSKKYLKERPFEILEVLELGGRLLTDDHLFNSVLKMLEK